MIQRKINVQFYKSVTDRVLDYCAYEEFVPDGYENNIVYFSFIEHDYYFEILLCLFWKLMRVFRAVIYVQK